MFSVLLATAVLVAVCWVYARWYQVKRYWAKKGVPHLPPHPIMGSLTFLQKQNPAVWMRDLYDRFRSPYVGVWLFWRPSLVINSPDLARKILVKDSAVFRDRFLGSGKKDPIGALNIFTVNDPLWSSIRRRLTPVFTAAKLRNVHGILNVKSKELIERIRMEMEKTGRVNLRIMFTDYTTDVVGTTSFGIASDATLTGESALRTVTKDFMKFSVYRGLCWSSIFFFPELTDIFGFTFFPKSATDYLSKVFRLVVDQRGGYDTKITENSDLLDALRKIKQDCNNDNEDISEETLIAQAAIFLQGGYETTAIALTFCVYELAFAPHVQEKIFTELNEFELKKRNGEIDSSMYNELPYIICVLKEILRKYAPMGWLDRIASKDYQIDDNLVITAGTPVYVNAIGMHYDPEIFPEPKKFNPDRFLPENEKNLMPFTFLPFGEGPRNCIGRRFAYQNIVSALSEIMTHYKIRPLPGTPLPSEVEIEKRGLFLFPGEHLYVEFVPRR